MSSRLYLKTSLEILKELEVHRNEQDECYASSLEDFLDWDTFCEDESNVYVEAKDGLLIIPYTYSSEYESVYKVLYTEEAYLAHENREGLKRIIKKKEDLLNRLKEHDLAL